MSVLLSTNIANRLNIRDIKINFWVKKKRKKKEEKKRKKKKKSFRSNDTLYKFTLIFCHFILKQLLKHKHVSHLFDSPTKFNNCTAESMPLFVLADLQLDSHVHAASSATR